MKSKAARFSLRPQLLAAVVFIVVSMSRAAFAGDIVLQDAELRVAFDSSTGALVRLENRSSHWVIERRPELGISFRLFAPLPEQRYNFVLGQKQKAVRVEKISDSEIQIEWKNLVSEHGGVLPMIFTADVTLHDV